MTLAEAPEKAAASAALAIDSVRIRFGGVVALDSVSFEIAPRAVVGLIGPNGAGKTTMFNCISGVYRPDRGTITCAGCDLTRVAQHEIASHGIARTFQTPVLFPSLSVLENVMVGAQATTRPGYMATILASPRVRRREAETRARAQRALELVDLGHHAARPASGFPLATLKRLELARALAGDPHILLLDEPASGLTHSEVAELSDKLMDLRAELDLTVVLIEHHMGMVTRVSDHLVVLDFGKKIAEGPPAAVQRDEKVIKAYLGAPR